MPATEEAVRFGRANHLIGIIGRPELPADTGVIVLNAGMVHRVGPFRLHVDLTRRLNAAGYPTMRMDLSTLGDSGASGESSPRVEQVREDVADAMTTLTQRTGCTRFVLAGLCAGASNSHNVALVNPKVAGAVFLDGYIYRTFGHLLRHHLPRLFRPRLVLRYLRKLPSRLRRHGEDIAFTVTMPPRSQVRADYAAMLKHRLKLCFVYSGGISDYFNHTRQFRECYGRGIANDPAVAVHYLPHTDHTYALTCDRKEVVDLIVDWVKVRFPVAHAPKP